MVLEVISPNSHMMIITTAMVYSMILTFLLITFFAIIRSTQLSWLCCGIEKMRHLLIDFVACNSAYYGLAKLNPAESSECMKWRFESVWYLTYALSYHW